MSDPTVYETEQTLKSRCITARRVLTLISPGWNEAIKPQEVGPFTYRNNNNCKFPAFFIARNGRDVGLIPAVRTVSSQLVGF